MGRKPKKPCDTGEMHERLVEFIEEVKTESDRGIVLSGGSLVEEFLRSVFWQFTRELPSTYSKETRKGFVNSFLGSGGIIGAHSRCMNLCFAFGIIDEPLYRQLDDIRIVRNRAGHDLRFRLHSEIVTAALERHYDKDSELPNSIQFVTPTSSNLDESGGSITSISMRGPWSISKEPGNENLILNSDEISWQKIAFISLIYSVGSALPTLGVKPSPIKLA